MEKRADDDPEFDPRGRRHWRGIDPTEYAEQDQLKLGWGDKSLTARGSLTVVIILVACVIGAMVYVGSRMESAVWAIGRLDQSEHEKISTRMDLRTCLDTLTVEEKKWLKEHWSPSAIQTVCAWMGSAAGVKSGGLAEQ